MFVFECSYYFVVHFSPFVFRERKFRPHLFFLDSQWARFAKNKFVVLFFWTKKYIAIVANGMKQYSFH